jgi:hypothetical protein
LEGKVLEAGILCIFQRGNQRLQGEDEDHQKKKFKTARDWPMFEAGSF